MPNQRSFGGIYKNPSSVNGLSINDIMSMDPNRIQTMTEKELRQVTSRLISAANKRISRFSYPDRAINPAIQSLKKAGLLDSGGKIRLNQQYVDARGNVMDKSVLQIFNATASFLRKTTSTSAGFKKHKKMLEDITKGIVRGYTEQDRDSMIADMWKSFFENYAPTAEARDKHYMEILHTFEKILPMYDNAEDASDSIKDEIDRIMSEGEVQEHGMSDYFIRE